MADTSGVNGTGLIVICHVENGEHDLVTCAYCAEGLSWFEVTGEEFRWKWCIGEIMASK